MDSKIENAVSLIAKYLKNGTLAKVEWDCGGDGGILTIYLANRPVPYENKDFEELEYLIAGKLSLPHVGETHARGGGTFIIENDILFLNYKTTYQKWTTAQEAEAAAYYYQRPTLFDELDSWKEQEKEIEKLNGRKFPSSLDYQKFTPEDYDYYDREINCYLVSGVLTGRLLIADLNQTNKNYAEDYVNTMTLEIENAINQLVECLQKNKLAQVEWDCGGDEAVLSFFLDEKKIEYGDAGFWALGDWLVDELKLPSVGEIFAKGSGIFVLENDALFLDYLTTSTIDGAYLVEYETCQSENNLILSDTTTGRYLIAKL